MIARPAPERLAYRVPDEAAASIGVDDATFTEHVKPHIRTICVGRVELVPAFELERFLGKNASEDRDAFAPAEAATRIGASRDFLDEHCLPEMRVVRRGRKVLIPRREIERWLDRSAAMTLGARGRGR